MVLTFLLSKSRLVIKNNDYFCLSCCRSTNRVCGNFAALELAVLTMFSFFCCSGWRSVFGRTSRGGYFNCKQI